MALAGLLAVHRADDPDFWFHLAAGRSIATHGLPQQEAWCLAARGSAPWLSEWLFHWSLFQTRSLGGDVAVGIWRALWSALALALALRVARAVGSGGWTAAAAVPLVLAVGRGRMWARPEQLLAVFLLAFVLAFESERRGSRRWTWALLPLQALWANVHASWILGPGLALIYAGCEAWRGRSDAASAVRARRWGLLAALLVAASALVPRPLATLAAPFHFVAAARGDPLHASIEELAPWSWAADKGDPFTGLAALLVVAAFLGGRRAWRASPALVLALLAMLILGLQALRFRALASLVALPFLGLALDFSSGTWRRWPAALAALAGAALGVGALIFTRGYAFGVGPRWESFPVRAVAMADSLRLEGAPFNTFHFGGYILWVRGEDHPPLIDGRGLGTREFRSRYSRSSYDEAALDSVLAEWRCTHALLQPPQSVGESRASHVFRRPGWALVFSDDAGLLFVRRDLYPAIVAARSYRLFSPDYRQMSENGRRAMADTVVASALVSELERARAESPWHARASFWLGAMRLAQGRASEASRLFDEVERLAPLTPGLALRQGIAREALGDRAGARAAYRRALRESYDAEDARQALERLARRE